jgi:hypothetical protein
VSITHSRTAARWRLPSHAQPAVTLAMPEKLRASASKSAIETARPDRQRRARRGGAHLVERFRVGAAERRERPDDGLVVLRLRDELRDRAGRRRRRAGAETIVDADVVDARRHPRTAPAVAEADFRATVGQVADREHLGLGLLVEQRRHPGPFDGVYPQPEVGAAAARRRAVLAPGQRRLLERKGVPRLARVARAEQLIKHRLALHGADDVAEQLDWGDKRGGKRIVGGQGREAGDAGGVERDGAFEFGAPLAAPRASTGPLGGASPSTATGGTSATPAAMSLRSIEASDRLRGRGRAVATQWNTGRRSAGTVNVGDSVTLVTPILACEVASISTVDPATAVTVTGVNRPSISIAPSCPAWTCG